MTYKKITTENKIRRNSGGENIDQEIFFATPDFVSRTATETQVNYHLFIIILQKDTSRPDKVGTHINTYSYLIYIRDQF